MIETTGESKAVKTTDEWFTVEKAGDGIFCIAELKHYEQVRSYIVLGGNKALLIDTGLGVCNIKKAVGNITDLPVSVATTHVHWDHIGGHKYFEDIAVHEKEKEWIKKFPLSLSEVKKELLKFPCDFPKDFDVEKYEIFSGAPTVILKDGDEIDLGGRKITIVHTPGHSPGHVCFYERDAGYLFSGDLLYRGELNVSFPTTDPVAFKKSVGKVKELNPTKIFPAHHGLDLKAGFAAAVYNALENIERAGKLKHGGGVFFFDDFSVRL
ncbi:MAG: MBL fold metallo-hydrolase [Clostridia bacterium]|nr:MBL fold metallo-hydrolase [Clostridia bacterium]